jgi:hypothetical protein
MFHATIHLESKVASFDDWVEELLEVMVRLDVTGVAADERIRVKGSGVDGSGDGPTVGSFVIFEFFEELLGDAFGHEGLMGIVFFV